MLIELAGLSFRPKEAKEIVANLEVGAKLCFELEPDNPYDPYAVRIIEPMSETFIGYVPRTASALIYQLLEEGRDLPCELAELHPKKPILRVEMPK